MLKPKSEYRISALRNLPPALLGSETYSVVAATEINLDLILAEYFLLVQRPTAKLIQGTIELNMANFPEELEKWTISNAVDEAQRQIEIEVANLLEGRAEELNRQDLAYLPFEFKSTGVGLIGPWMRGQFQDQIRSILHQTRSPKLKIYLGYLARNLSNTQQKLGEI